MSTKYKKLKNNALTKAKQTRIEQVNAKAKKYNKKVSKSDEAYINGNIRQASAMRAYGIKQARAKGEEVYGYSKDDVYKARKNQLTVGKEINKDKAKYLYTNKKTTVPGGTRKDGSTYDSFTSRKRMLTDDEKTSLSKYGDLYDKNKESKQYKWMDSSKKDAKNLLEHMNTFRMDGMKTANVRAREEKGLGKLKEYGTGLAKDILIDPLVDTLRVADTVGGSLTGAGLGALENLDNLMKGYELDKDLISNNFKSSIKSSNETGWSKSSSEVLREREERQFLKDKEYYNNDEIMKKMYGTSDLEQHKKNIEKGTKYAGFIWDIIGDPTDIVNVVGKNLLKNTAKSGKELLTGTADISTAFKSKHLDDIFSSSKPYEDLKIFDDNVTNKINNQLDNGYNRAVSNDVKVKVKEKVSTNPQTPLLSSYLDELDNNLEDKKRISDILHSYDGGDVNEYLEMLDELDDDTYYKVVDMAEKHNPWLYKQMIEGADDIDEMAYDDKVNKLINDSYTKTDDKYTNTKSLRKLSNIPEANGKSLLENYNEFNKLRIGKTYDEIAPRMSVSETKSIFKERLDSFMSLSKDADPIMIESVIKRINNIIEEDTPSYKKAEMLNKMLFGKEDIIRANIPEKTLNDVLEYMSNNLTLTLADKMGDTTADLLRNGTKQTEDIYNHKGLLKLEDKNAMFAPSATDIQYEQKMSDIASYLGVPNKASLTVPRDELKALRKKRVLTTDEYYKLQDLEQQIKKWDDLYKDVANMGDEYAEYSYKKYGKNNPLDGFNKIVQEQADIKRTEKLTSHDIEQQVIDELKELDVKDITQDEIDELVNARTKEYYDEMNKYNAKDPHKKSKTKPLKLKELEEKALRAQVSILRKQLNLPEVKAPNVKVKLTKGQKLRDLPPVKESLKNLRSVIEKEVDYMYKNPQSYSSVEKAFKQIKTDYVNTLRQMGVPDDKYFHKVKALQDELKATFENGIKSDSPLVKMDLQRLARRISETFDEINNIVLDNISEETPLELLGDVKTELVKATNPFDRFMNKINTKSNLRPQSKLPDPKYKLTKDKDLINLETGETKPFFDRNTTLEEYNEKIYGGYKQQNIEEFERLQTYVNNPEKYSIYDVMNLMETMNIKFNPNDTKSMDNALNKFFWIIEKKGIVPKQTQEITPKTVKSMRNIPKAKLKKLSNETKDIVDNPMDLIENRALQDVSRDEIIDNARKLYEREEKTSMFDRLFQQLETKEKMNGFTPLYKQVDEYSNSLEGLNKYYSNLAKNDEVIEKLNLAKKGINPNKVTSNNDVLQKMSNQMNKAQYSSSTNRNYEQLVRQAIERGDIDERIAERLTSEMLEKVSNSKVNWGDIKTKRELDVEKQIESTKKIHSKIDELNEQYKTDDFGVIKEKKNFFDKVFNKNKSIDKPVVEDDLNTQSLGKMIEDDVEKFSKEIKEKNNFFNKMFQENNGEKLGYEDNEIYNAYKRWLNSYKKGHTVYNPGWHVQNYFQNKGQNYLALGMDAFAPQTKAKNLLHEIKGKSNKAQDSYGKYSKNEIIDFIKQNGVVDGLGEDVISSNGIFPKLETSIDNSGFMKKLGESEQTARLHHFLTQLERGKSMEESLKSVNDTLFDYSKKTNLDKVISDFVDPFWVFHKNNAKLIGKSAIKNSDKFSRLDRGLRNLGEPGEDGKRGTGHKFVDDVNKDEYEYRYKQQILPDARESLSISDGDIENKLNPLLQLAMKHSKGEGNFGNKIVDGEANWGEITKDEAIKEALLDVNPFMPQLVKFINNATDKKDRAESGKQSEETSNKQILHDFITFITGNKGNYYRQH